MQIACLGASPDAQAILGAPWPGGAAQAQSVGVDFWSALLHWLAATSSAVLSPTLQQTEEETNVRPLGCSSYSEFAVESHDNHFLREFKEGKEVLTAGALAVVSASPDVLPVLVSSDDGLLEAQAVPTEAPAREKLLTLMAMLSAAELVPVRVKVPSQQSHGMVVVPSATSFGRTNEDGDLVAQELGSALPAIHQDIEPRSQGMAVMPSATSSGREIEDRDPSVQRTGSTPPVAYQSIRLDIIGRAKAIHVNVGIGNSSVAEPVILERRVSQLETVPASWGQPEAPASRGVMAGPEQEGNQPTGSRPVVVKGSMPVPREPRGPEEALISEQGIAKEVMRAGTGKGTDGVRGGHSEPVRERTGSLPAKGAATSVVEVPVEPLPAKGVEASKPVGSGGEMPDTLAELMDRVQVGIRRGESEWRLRLRPPELGHLEVRLVAGARGVSLLMQAETPEAQALIQSHLDQLCTSLDGRGIRLERCEVVLSQGGTDLTDLAGGAFGWQGPSWHLRDVPERVLFTLPHRVIEPAEGARPSRMSQPHSLIDLQA